MRTYAQKRRQPRQGKSGEPAPPSTAPPSHEVQPGDVDEFEAGSTATASSGFRHNLSLIPIYPPEAGTIQAKSQINKPGDEYEQEADRIAAQVMRLPDQPEKPAQGPARLETKHVGSGDLGETAVPPIVHDVLRSAGQPLDPATHAFMTPRFGYDFSRVQVHAGAAAEQSARSLNAHAYTVGDQIVFGAGRFAPGTQEGRRLIAHELTHVVQQSGSVGTRVDATNEKPAPSSISLTSPVQVQRDEIEMLGTDLRPKGLLAPKQIQGVSSRWVQLWQSKKDATIRALFDSMLATVNAELSGLGVAPMVFDPTPAKTEGGFRRQEWRVSVNLEIRLGRKVRFDDKASSLSADELAEIGGTLYHEARHAEQAFLVARKRATTIRDPNALAKNLEVPVSIANAAIRAGPPGPSDPSDELIEEWSAFEPSGKHFAYWQWNEVMKQLTAETLEPVVSSSPRTPDEFRATAEVINTKINVLSTKWSFPYEQIIALEKLPAPKPVDREVLAQLRKITAAFDKLVLAIDHFRTKASLLALNKSEPDESKGDPHEREARKLAAESRLLDAEGKWLDVRGAQLELFIAQDAAYRAYPHEADAGRAGEAAKDSILAATRKAPAR